MTKGLTIVLFQYIFFLSLHSYSAPLACQQLFLSPPKEQSQTSTFTKYKQRLKGAFAKTKYKLKPYFAEAFKPYIDQLFKKDNLIFSMSQSENLRDIILESVQKDGDFEFKNIHQTKTTNANMSVYYRIHTENSRMNLNFDDASQLPAEELPKYGYLQFKETPFSNNGGLHKLVYGNPKDLHGTRRSGGDIWIFDTNDLYDSTTMTIGDSAVYFPQQKIKPFTLISNQNIESELMNQHQLDQVDVRFVPMTTKNLTQWITDRLFASNVEAEIQSPLRPNNNSKSKRRSNDDVISEIFYAWTGQSVAMPYFHKNLQKAKSNLAAGSSFNSNYFELQFFGRLTLNQNPKQFIFTQNPPSPDFAKLLRSRGIEVLSWLDHQEAPVLWRGN